MTELPATCPLPRHIILTANTAWNILNFRRPLILALLKDGHRITVLAPADESVSDLKEMGCRFIPLKMDVKGLSPLRDLQLMRRFHRHFRAEKPDVVLSYTIKNNIFGALGAAMSGTKFIPNVTGLGTAFLSGGVLQGIAEMLYRAAFRRLRIVFFQNTDDRDLFVNRNLVKPDQARLLPGSGIDLQHYSAMPLPPASGPPVFLMIARLLRDKGVQEYVQAARLIKADHPDVRFQILGETDTENRSALGMKDVKEWEAEGVIQHLGATSDVRPFIKKADCVVLPSYREGAPRTLIEAAAMARPLIATDVAGCRSVIDAGLSGLLCEARNAESLATALRRFLSLSHAERNRFAQAGRQKMQREFDQDIVVAAYRKAIGDILKDKG